MPIYEYRCERGHTFEVMQRMSEDPLETCETCGAPAQRVLHPVAIHFKGKGFYNTDYGTRKRNREKQAASTAGGSDSSNGSKDTGGDGAKGESKSEAKSSDSSSSSKSKTKPAAAAGSK